MTARRSGTLAVASVAAGVVVAVLLVTWAASIGPSAVLRGDGPTPDPPTVEPTSRSVSPTPDAEPEQELRPADATNGAGLLGALAIILNVAAGVVVIVLLARLARWLVRLRRVRRERQARQAEVDAAAYDVIDPGAAVARGLIADAGAQRDALAEGAPRNAVVECWHRFEVTAAAAGIDRHPWETSSEFTLRMLDLVAADPSAVSQLAGLYREARYSEHDLTETDRAAALDALDSIHRTIGAGV